MKRVDLIKAIEAFGCELVRNGARHDWYRNPATGVSHPSRATARSTNIWPAVSSACSATQTLATAVRMSRRAGDQLTDELGARQKARPLARLGALAVRPRDE